MTEGFARKSPHHSTCCRDTWGRRFISPWSWPSYLLPLQQQPSLQGQSRPFLAAVLADSSSFPCPPCTSLTFGLHGPEERGSSSLSRSPMWLQVAHQPLPLPFHLSLLQGTRHNSSSSRFLLSSWQYSCRLWSSSCSQPDPALLPRMTRPPNLS